MKLNKQSVFKTGSAVAIVTVGIAAMIALGSTDKQSNQRTQPEEVRLVETQHITFSNLTIEIQGSGVIESQRSLNHISEASGVVLFAKNDLKNGTFVREGELVIEIDSREVENNLFTLRSEFLNSIASALPEIKVEDATAYEKWYNYFTNLDIQKTTPELPQIASSQERIKLSTRNIFNKYYSVKNQEILLSKYKILAPFNGYIKSNGVIENSYVSKGQQLFTLSDAGNVEIAIPLLVDQISFIDLSSAPVVEIIADQNSSQVLTGRITRKETNIDRNSQSLNVYVSFNNSNLNSYFLPGNYVSVKIKGKNFNNVAKIPRNLVDNDGYVYTMENEKLSRQKVELVTIQGNTAIVKNNLPENTRIITTILQKPLIGMKIKSADDTKVAHNKSNENSKREQTTDNKVAQLRK
jgi:multidrug efflux pump subunit AcrA (membrane-fusion protein)